LNYEHFFLRIKSKSDKKGKEKVYRGLTIITKGTKANISGQIFNTFTILKPA